MAQAEQRFRTDDRLRDVHTNHEHADGDSRSLTHLIKELRDESTLLLRQEVALAKTEMSEKASRVTRNASYLAVGGGLALGGLLILLMALTAGLYVGLVALEVSHMTAGWLAPLIVGAVVALLGYAFVQKGISALKHETLVPERTKESLQQDKEWLKEKVQ